MLCSLLFFCIFRKISDRSPLTVSGSGSFPIYLQWADLVLFSPLAVGESGSFPDMSNRCPLTTDGPGSFPRFLVYLQWMDLALFQTVFSLLTVDGPGSFPNSVWSTYSNCTLLFLTQLIVGGSDFFHSAYTGCIWL